MIRSFTGCLLLLFAAAGLAAQDHGQHDRPAGQQAAHGEHAHHPPPAGWLIRTDRDQPAEQIRFMGAADHFHVVTGPAAVFYHPDWRHRGDFRVSARFRQNRAPQHPESYGIVVGGRGLDGAEQSYAYLLVRGTGEYFIALRRGAERERLVDWTRHPAVVAAGEDGRATNTLAVEVRGDEVRFLVNDAEVARRPRAEIDPDGVFGFRINHHLDVRVDEVHR